MTTLTSLVEQTRRSVLGNQRETLNKLASAVTSTSQTTLTFSYDIDGIKEGAEIELGYEKVYVWSTNSSAKTAEVERGYGGTSASTYSVGQLVIVNPRISKQEIVDQMNYELADLSSPMNRLFQVDYLDLEGDPAQVGYDIDASEIIEVLDIRYEHPTFNDWPRITNWNLSRNQSTDDFASGAALLINEVIFTGSTIRVQYSKAFSSLSSSATSSVEAQTGLPSSAVDILHLGAALRIFSTREIARNYMGAQPDPRRAEEVPPGATSASVRDLRLLHDRRVKEEAARLITLYPLKMKGWPI